MQGSPPQMGVISSGLVNSVHDEWHALWGGACHLTTFSTGDCRRLAHSSHDKKLISGGMMRIGRWVASFCSAAMLGGIALFGFAGATPAEASCSIQRHCVLKQRIEYRTQYRRSCDTVNRYEGRMFVPRTYCTNRPIRSPYPVTYQDCSQTKRVCNSLGSLIGSRNRR